MVIARPCNNIGPNQYPEKMAPLFITNALDDQPLPVYGDGRQVRDWLFVKDNCEALDLLLHKGAPGEVYNVGAGNERPNMDVVEGILDLLGKPRSLIRFVEDRPGHDRRYALDCAKIRALGWSPRHDFDAVARGDRRAGTSTTAGGGRRSSPAPSAPTTRSSTAPGSPRPAALRPRAPSPQNRMRIFVTGNRGQLGRELMRALAGHDVDGGDLPELDITDADADASSHRSGAAGRRHPRRGAHRHAPLRRRPGPGASRQRRSARATSPSPVATPARRWST